MGPERLVYVAFFSSVRATPATRRRPAEQIQKVRWTNFHSAARPAVSMTTTVQRLHGRARTEKQTSERRTKRYARAFCWQRSIRFK